MNKNLDLLHPYPFEKLSSLVAGVTPSGDYEPIALSIGEPQHSPPAFVIQTLTEKLDKLAKYPSTKGLPELRQTNAQWATRRFELVPGSLDPEHNILPVNGTREALFAFVQATLDKTQAARSVIMPNPFYQIYEGAALLAGGPAVFLNCTEENGFVPDFDAVSEKQWQECQIVFICSPGNPTGALTSLAQLKKIILLADKYDFVVASDECYSEIYRDESQAPAGLLQACAELGRDDYKRCLVFHSLSKRSNLPGLRSGFVAGDAEILKKFLLYRTYHGCAMSVPVQLASIAAWEDEQHVIDNRRLYREKFEHVCKILNGVLEFDNPDAGFYLWPRTPVDDALFSRALLAQKNVAVLPGQFLARDTEDGNPGQNRIRLALVAELNPCIDAAERIRDFVICGDYS